jgi:hypothetical protein
LKRKEAKRSETIEVKFYSEQAKNIKKTDPISLYFAYKRKKFLSETGAPYFKVIKFELIGTISSFFNKGYYLQL